MSQDILLEILVPTLRRGNAIPRRSRVAEVLTNCGPFTCTSDAGASFQVRSHAPCVGTRSLQTS
jgi:hypothetical protein